MLKIQLTILSIIFVSLNTFSQCAMCAASVESNDENLVGQGLNFGIIFLMSAPYILVSVVGFIWYKRYKKLKQE